MLGPDIVTDHDISKVAMPSRSVQATWLIERYRRRHGRLRACSTSLPGVSASKCLRFLRMPFSTCGQLASHQGLGIFCLASAALWQQARLVAAGVQPAV